MRKRLLAVAAALLAGVACDEDRAVGPPAAQAEERPVPAAGAPEPAAEAQKPPPAGRGTVVGRVTLSGPAPERKLLDLSQDPFCAKTKAWDESVLVGVDGGLKDVFVRVADVTEQADPPAEPAVLDQTACVYRPRVQGVVAGRRLEVRNGDATLHNVHTYRGARTLFNQAQPEGGKPLLKRIKAATPDEPDVLTVKCDVHPWMVAHVFVSPHPHFAVTGEDGGFSLAGVPAGRRTLEVWHEVFGKLRLGVEVPVDGEARADFAFAPQEAP